MQYTVVATLPPSFAPRLISPTSVPQGSNVHGQRSSSHGKGGGDNGLPVRAVCVLIRGVDSVCAQLGGPISNGEGGHEISRLQGVSGRKGWMERGGGIDYKQY